MDKLFEEPINVVVDISSSAVDPTPEYIGMGIHHESIHLHALEEVVALIGGSVCGEEVHV